MAFGSGGDSALSPEEAFDVLGNETRVQILHSLGEANEPLAFSELFERVDYDTTANFSYHLDKLDGHFLHQTDGGYALRQVGRRVVEAVLSGAVTDDPVVERTPVDMACFLCGEPAEMRYREERVALYCTACGGTRSGTSASAEWAQESEADILGHVTLPPAGVRDRTPSEIIRAAEVWTVTEALATSRGVCPRCSAPVDQTVSACEDHETTDGRCDNCDQRFAATIQDRCTNCVYDQTSVFTRSLLGHTALMSFMIDHGVDPISPEAFHLATLDEEIRSADSFEARFTFTVDGDSLHLTVDANLNVVEVARGCTAD